MKKYTLENTDCLEFLKTIQDNTIGHINNDPPYNIGYDGGDNWDTFKDDDTYLNWCREWITECTRVLMPGRVLAIWGTEKNDLFYRLKLDVLNKIPGLVAQNPIIWNYNWGGRIKKNFPHKFETCFVYSKGDEFLFNADDVRVERKMKKNIRTGLDFEKGTIPTNVWESTEPIETNVWTGNLSTISKEAKESKFHPTVKPQFILERMIKAYSNPNEKVLDIFSGSGSTCIASLATNREFIGCERNKEYFEKSLERIKKHI